VFHGASVLETPRLQARGEVRHGGCGWQSREVSAADARMSAKDGIFKEGRRRIAFAALIAASFLAAGASAGTAPPKAVAKAETPAAKITTPAQRCAALEKQFDDAVKNGTDGHGLAAAKKMRAEGGHLCEAGKHATGALWLSRALAGIGLAPKEP
jgi:hypothetical protein